MSFYKKSLCSLVSFLLIESLSAFQYPPLITKQAFQYRPLTTKEALSSSLGSGVGTVTGTISQGSPSFSSGFTSGRIPIYDPFGVDVATIGGTTYAYAVSNGDNYMIKINTALSVPVTQGTITLGSMGFGWDIAAALLNSLNGNCPPATQGMINQLLSLPLDSQEIALIQLGPIFKVAQFSLEKLNFLIQKELQDTLYTERKGSEVVLLAGYDNLKQQSVHSYTGYKVNSFYQLAGLSYGWDKMKAMGGVGVSESYMNHFSSPRVAQASYPTVYGALGMASVGSRWTYGLEGLFGYSFINTRKNIDFLNAKGKSHHGIWNTSIESHVAYDVQGDFYLFSLYDDIGYIYGQENKYTESGAPGANLSVKNETISLIRNSLGFKLGAPKANKVKVFGDLAWVYEHYLQSNTYYAAFQGTTLYGAYTQKTPATNYIRVGAGFMGTYADMDWQLTYRGLYGSKFIEQSVSVRLGYKF